MTLPTIYSPAQLANHIKLVRQKNQWTQSDLARRIGIKQATISNFENHPDKTTLTTLFKILQSLEMTMVVCEKGATSGPEQQDSQRDMEW
ncbi:type II toxin-antitoxin system antitoxin HipB [Raoultella terrigena]|uniref:type II toxin-antitoxin system antitoxin HipB n=1 Tax=Raoultella terrigena TaxID=577 RepID=UPI00349F6270